MNLQPSILQNPDILRAVLKKNSFDCLDDMYAAIGYGGLTAVKAANRVRDDLQHATRAAREQAALESRQTDGKPSHRNTSGVVVEGIDSCMLKFSRCCTPVPGDEIIGFVTKGYGVSIHRKDCPNAQGSLDPAQQGRWVKVSWANDENESFYTTLEIESTDRDGLWLDVTTVMTQARVKISELSGKDLPGNRAITTLTIEVQNVEELNRVRTKLRSLPGVMNIRRGQQ